MSLKLVSLDQGKMNGPASSAGWSLSTASAASSRTAVDRRTISEFTWIIASDFQECSLFAIDAQRTYVGPCLAETLGVFGPWTRGPIEDFGAFW